MIDRDDRESPLSHLVPQHLRRELYYLPQVFQNQSFWQDLKKSEQPIWKLQKLVPQSMTFRYRSAFQPQSDLYLSVLQEKGWIRFVHFDRDQNVNVLSVPASEAQESLLATLSIAERRADEKLDTANGRCFRCHQEAAIAIVPRQAGLWMMKDPPAQEPIAWFNSHFIKHRSTGASELFKDFPAVGSGHGLDFDQFLANCMGSTSIKKLRLYQEASRCVLCHDDKSVTTLRFPLGNGVILDENQLSLDRLIHQDLGMATRYYGSFALGQYFIESGHMPLDMKNAMSQQERSELFRCLMTDYLGGMFPDAAPRFRIKQGLLREALFKIACQAN